MLLVSIHTPRLLIRTPISRDAASYVAIWRNEANCIYDPAGIMLEEDPVKRAELSVPWTEEDYVDSITSMQDNLQDGKDAKIVVCLPVARQSPARSRYSLRARPEPALDRVIGVGGFNSFELDIPTGTVTADFGLVMDVAETGKGYAQEVIAACLDWAFGVVVASASEAPERICPGASISQVLHIHEKTADVVKMETLAINAPWCALMAKLGIDGVDGQGKDGGDIVFWLSKDEWLRKRGTRP